MPHEIAGDRKKSAEDRRRLKKFAEDHRRNSIDIINQQKTVENAENRKRSQNTVKNGSATRKYRRKTQNDCRRPQKIAEEIDQIN